MLRGSRARLEHAVSFNEATRARERKEEEKIPCRASWIFMPVLLTESLCAGRTPLYERGRAHIAFLFWTLPNLRWFHRNILRLIETYAPEVHGKIPHKSASGPGRTSSRIFLRDSRTVTYRPLAPGLLLDPIIIDLRGVQCSYIGSPPSQVVL